MTPTNPFYVLELPPDATPGTVEREGRRLLGLLQAGAEKARRYRCPLGTFTRDETAVREAMAKLQHPQERSKHACLAVLMLAEDEAPSMPGELDAPLVDALLAGGYRGL